MEINKETQILEEGMDSTLPEDPTQQQRVDGIDARVKGQEERAKQQEVRREAGSGEELEETEEAEELHS